MSRFTNFVLYSAVLALLWLALFTGTVPLPGLDERVKNEILAVVPWWCLVSFGSYLLWQIGWGIFNFNDVPEAYQGLMGDIKTAKDFLRQRGVDVD